VRFAIGLVAEPVETHLEARHLTRAHARRQRGEDASTSPRRDRLTAAAEDVVERIRPRVGGAGQPTTALHVAHDLGGALVEVAVGRHRVAECPQPALEADDLVGAIAGRERPGDAAARPRAVHDGRSGGDRRRCGAEDDESRDTRRGDGQREASSRHIRTAHTSPLHGATVRAGVTRQPVGGGDSSPDSARRSTVRTGSPRWLAAAAASSNSTFVRPAARFTDTS